MKRIIITLGLAALALPAVAEDAPDFNTGTVTFGLQQRDVDTVSSKYFEYRDIPNGGTAPWFSFQGKKGDYRYDFYGKDVTQKDQRYYGKFEGKSWVFQADYTGIPHAFGNNGKSILNVVQPNEWRISDTLQSTWQANLIANRPKVNYDYLYALVRRPSTSIPPTSTSPSSATARTWRSR
jgi:hypothetical protein